jgi:hypothetical protein
VNIGNVEILLNNPYVIVGEVAGLADGGAGVGRIGCPVTGAMVRARVQSGPVRVGFGSMPGRQRENVSSAA